MNNKNSEKSKYKNISCPNCKSESIIKRGKRKTENRGLIQRFGCKDCSHRFVQDDGFYRMRNNSQKITCAIDLFYRGVSLRKCQGHFKAFYPHNSSHMSIYRWIVKYSEMIYSYTENLKNIGGKELMSDEMEYAVKGSQGWFVDVMDTDTRYIVSSQFMKSRTIENLNQVMYKAKINTQDRIKVITTDGLQGYPRVLRKTFNVDKNYGYSSHRKTNNNIKHNIVIASERGFNHKIERLHNNIRERTKIFRGFGSMDGATSIMRGYEIFHNFVRTHQAINRCPYELAIPELKDKLNVPNKWLALIELATQNN